MWLVDCCAHGYVVPTTVGTQLQYCRVGGIVLMNPSRIWWWTASTKFLHTIPDTPTPVWAMDLPTVYVHQARLCGVAQGHGGGMGCIVGNPSTARIQPAPSWPPPCAAQVHPIWPCDVICSARSSCTFPLHSYAQLATATRKCQHSGPRRAPPDTAVNE